MEGEMQDDSKPAKFSFFFWVSVLTWVASGGLLLGFGIVEMFDHKEPIPGYISYLAGVVMAIGGLLIFGMIGMTFIITHEGHSRDGK